MGTSAGNVQNSFLKLNSTGPCIDARGGRGTATVAEPISDDQTLEECMHRCEQYPLCTAISYRYTRNCGRCWVLTIAVVGQSETANYANKISCHTRSISIPDLPEEQAGRLQYAALRLGSERSLHMVQIYGFAGGPQVAGDN